MESRKSQLWLERPWSSLKHHLKFYSFLRMCKVFNSCTASTMSIQFCTTGYPFCVVSRHSYAFYEAFYKVTLAQWGFTKRNVQEHADPKFGNRWNCCDESQATCLVQTFILGWGSSVLYLSNTILWPSYQSQIHGHDRQDFIHIHLLLDQRFHPDFHVSETFLCS